jgi:hypothetical protein
VHQCCRGQPQQQQEQAGLAIKNPPKKPTQKTHPKTHLKKPLKWFFWVFKNFTFFMRIIKTFLFETDFFYEQIRHKLSFIYKK